MFTKKKYHSNYFSYTTCFFGINLGQIGNTIFPEIDKNVLILAGLIIGVIVTLNFIYQHIKARKINCGK
jgi:hypothetical protein